MIFVVVKVAVKLLDSLAVSECLGDSEVWKILSRYKQKFYSHLTLRA